MIKNNIKGFIIGVISTAVVMSPLSAFAAEAINAVLSNITIVVNGTVIKPENQPITINGRTYLPLRDVANAVGLEVNYDSNTNTAYLGTAPANLTQTPSVQTPSTQPAKKEYYEYDDFLQYLQETGQYDPSKNVDAYGEFEESAKGIPSEYKNYGSGISNYYLDYYYNQFLKPGMRIIAVYGGNYAVPKKAVVVKSSWSLAGVSGGKAPLEITIEGDDTVYMNFLAYESKYGKTVYFYTNRSKNLLEITYTGNGYNYFYEYPLDLAISSNDANVDSAGIFLTEKLITQMLNSTPVKTVKHNNY